MHELELNERVRLRVLDGDPERTAVMLPGFAAGCSVPLLRYATILLQARGWQVTQVEWDPIRDDAWVIEQARAAVDRVAAARPLVVAKSLGSRALPLAVERGLPGVWLTPLLHLPDVAAALGHATAPTLLVGGTADEAWDGELAARLPVERLEIAGADHGLELGDPYASLEALRTVVRRIDDWLEALPASL